MLVVQGSKGLSVISVDKGANVESVSECTLEQEDLFECLRKAKGIKDNSWDVKINPGTSMIARRFYN
jgi:hypothetical protein